MNATRSLFDNALLLQSLGDALRVTPVFDNSLCVLCHVVVNFMLFLKRFGLPKQAFLALSKTICTSSNFSERFCDGMIDLNGEVLFYIVDNKPGLTPRHFCELILQAQGCGSNLFDWTIALPPKRRRAAAKQHGTATFKILHLSDIHYDSNYVPDGPTACKEAICCQADQVSTQPAEDGGRCKFWGSYAPSDAPWNLIEATIERVNKAHSNFDFVYFTGDVESHRSFDNTKAKNQAHISTIYTYLKNKFHGVPVFPVLGNHEFHPLNLLTSEAVAEEKFSIQWVFDLAAEHFSQLTGHDVRETVRRGGYYTVSPRPGFRIIALNNNFGYIYNFWLLYEDFDPYGQLQWLVKTLKTAEDNDESVHILMHIPSGLNDTFKVYAREYARIVDRFSGIIHGQFAGHSHLDEWQVYYSNANQPTGVVWNGASVTPYTANNPSYKLYDVDSSDFSLKNFEQWTFNLTAANDEPRKPIRWYKLYDFCSTYGVKNLKPIEVDKAVRNMIANPSLIETYHRLKSRNSDGVNQNCGNECKQSTLCEILTSVPRDVTHCKRFLDFYIHKTL